MKKRNRKFTNNKGFSLMEILLVIALLSVVVTLLARNIFPQFSKGKIQAARIQMKQIEGDLDRYRLDCNRYPTTAQGLKALTEEPAIAPLCPNYDPAGYISAKSQSVALKDPWGYEFKYTCEDGINYEITSLGQDNKPGGDGENADFSSNDEG